MAQTIYKRYEDEATADIEDEEQYTWYENILIQADINLQIEKWKWIFEYYQLYVHSEYLGTLNVIYNEKFD